MKKLTVFISCFALVGALFTSCSDDTTKLGPSIEILSSASVTVAANSIITIKWRANAGDGNMKTFTIKEGNSPIIDEDGKDWTLFDIPNAQNEAYVDSARVQVGTANTSFSLIVTDNNDKTDTKTVTITIDVSQQGGPINTYEITLGSYNAAEGSSFASIDGTVYTIANAKANSNKIDLMYFWGASATNHASIAAPDDPVAETVFIGGNGLSTWTTQNATRFKTTSLSAGDFDDLDDDLAIVAAAEGASSSKISTLAVGDVVAFQTASTSAHSDKAGLFKVAAINGEASNGTIDLVVKVQE